MRKVLIMVTALAVLVSASGAGGDRADPRVKVGGGISVRVPAGWHVLHGWLSYVTDPVPSLAMGSFPAKLSHHTCACGFPNVVPFPRRGAFVFVWEYPHPSHRALARTPRRPAHFRLTADRRVRDTCRGPSDSLWFKAAGRGFQVEVYLGPRAGPALREQVAAMLDSLHIQPRAEPRA